MRSPSELEKMLWKSAEADAPPKDGAKRLAAALTGRLEALSSNPTSAPSLSPSPSSGVEPALEPVTASPFATWKVIVSIVAVAVPLSITVVGFRSGGTAPPAPSPPAVVATSEPRPDEHASSRALPTEPVGAAVSVRSIDELPSAVATTIPPPTQRTRAPAPRNVATATPEPTAAPAAAPPPIARTSELDAEVAALDEVREQLRTGASSRAMTLLAQYDARFPRGLLQPEAKVLQIEATAAAGDKARAHDLALAFLARYPNDSHAARIRQLEAQLRP